MELERLRAHALLSEKRVALAWDVKPKGNGSIWGEVGVIDPMKTRRLEVSAGTEEKLAKAAEYKANAKAGSLASKANMVKEFNERNSRK